MAPAWPLVTLLSLLAGCQQASGGRSQQRKEAVLGLTPTTLLLVSSPSAQKISYLELSDSTAVHEGTSKPLIDTGLAGPRGLAFDGNSGKLYVADPATNRILAYALEARRCQSTECKLDYDLVVAGPRLLVVENVLSSWVSIDGEGNLYFSDQNAKTINRVDRQALEKLSTSALQASDLKVVSELELDALVAAGASPSKADSGRAQTALRMKAQSSVVALHEAANGGGNVGTPGGLVADGSVVYWTNTEQGFVKGSVAAGAANLETPLGVNKSLALSNTTDGAYGVANTFKKVLFTGSEELFAVSKATKETSMVSDAMTAPRGIAWDGDNTVYVADMGGSAIYSLACGRDGPNQPVHPVASFPGPFGLAIIKSSDLSLLVKAAADADSAIAGAAPSGNGNWFAAWFGLA